MESHERLEGRAPAGGVPRIAVMGAGAVGGYLGGMLARAGADVALVARGPHLQAVRRLGLTVRGEAGEFRVRPRATDSPQEVGPVDLVLFTVKTYQNGEAIPLCRPLVGPDTTVLSLQNGVLSWEELQAGLVVGHVLPGAVYIEAQVEAPGVVRQQGGVCRVVLGEAGGPAGRRGEAAAALLRGAGVPTELSDDVVSALWSKWLFVSALAGVTTAGRLSMAEVMAVPESRELVVRVMREIEAVGRKRGVALADDVVERTLAYMDAEASSMKASMQTDLENGRPLELEALTGAVVRLGRAAGVPTPANEAIYGLLKPHAGRWL